MVEKASLLEALENLKEEEYSDYDIGYNVGLEHGISVICDMIRNSKENKKTKEPIRMSKLEYIILEYLADNTKHMYITRDANGKLFLYDMEPHKDKNEDWWIGKGVEPFIPFNDLFQFVKWSDKKPKAIKEVLNNCIVIGDRV